MTPYAVQLAAAIQGATLCPDHSPLYIVQGRQGDFFTQGAPTGAVAFVSESNEVEIYETRFDRIRAKIKSLHQLQDELMRNYKAITGEIDPAENYPTPTAEAERLLNRVDEITETIRARRRELQENEPLDRYLSALLTERQAEDLDMTLQQLWDEKFPDLDPYDYPMLNSLTYAEMERENAGAKL